MGITSFIQQPAYLLYTCNLLITVRRPNLQLRTFEMRIFRKPKLPHSHLCYIHTTSSYPLLHYRASSSCTHVVTSAPFPPSHFDCDLIVIHSILMRCAERLSRLSRSQASLRSYATYHSFPHPVPYTSRAFSSTCKEIFRNRIRFRSHL